MNFWAQIWYYSTFMLLKLTQMHVVCLIFYFSLDSLLKSPAAFSIGIWGMGHEPIIIQVFDQHLIAPLHHLTMMQRSKKTVQIYISNALCLFKKISTLRSQFLLLMLLSSFRIYTPKIHIWKWQFRNQIWEKNMQYLSNIHLIYDFQFHPFLQMSLFHFHLWLNKTPWCICIPFSLFIPLWWTCKMVPVLSSCESSSNKYRSQVSLH